MRSIVFTESAYIDSELLVFVEREVDICCRLRFFLGCFSRRLFSDRSRNSSINADVCPSNPQVEGVLQSVLLLSCSIVAANILSGGFAIPLSAALMLGRVPRYSSDASLLLSNP